MKLRFCRVCGKKGIKFASDGCKYCGSAYVSDIVWEIKKKEGLTKGRVLNNKLISKKKDREHNKNIIKNIFITTTSIIGLPLFFLIFVSILAIFWGFIVPFFLGWGP